MIFVRSLIFLIWQYGSMAAIAIGLAPFALFSERAAIAAYRTTISRPASHSPEATMTVFVGTDTARTRRELEVGGIRYAYYSIPAAEAAGLGDFSRLPAALKVVLENMLATVREASTGASFMSITVRPTMCSVVAFRKCVWIRM